MKKFAKLRKTLFSVLMLAVVTILTTILVLDIMFIHYGPSIEGGTTINPYPIPSNGIGKDEYTFGDEMDLDIFDMYFLEEGVASSNEDKVIAPGTRNEHVLYVTNEFDFALDYHIVYHSTTGDYELPLLVKLRNDEGDYLIGSETTYGHIEDLVNIKDINTVGGNRYHYYVFEWYWPFESNDDNHDTNLGNLTITEEVEVILEVKMNAVASEDVDSKDGIPLPSEKEAVVGQTVMTTVVLLLALLIVVVAAKSKRKRVYHSED